MASNDIFDFGGSSDKKADDANQQTQPFSVMEEVENLKAETAVQSSEAVTDGAPAQDDAAATGGANQKTGIAALLQNKVAVGSIAFFGLIVAFVIFRTFVYQAPQPMEQDTLSQNTVQGDSGGVFQGDNSLPPGMGGEPIGIPPAMMEPSSSGAQSQYETGVPSGIPQDMAVFGADPSAQAAGTPSPNGYAEQTAPPVVVEAAPATPPASSTVEAQPAVAAMQPEAPIATAPPVESESEIALLKKQIEDRDAKIKNLQSQLSASRREYSKLASVSKKLLAKEKEMVAYAKESSDGSTKAAPVKAAQVSSMYSIKAIVEGLAWLNTSDGRVITVRSGDTLAKNVSVISIDPIKMIVRTSAGEIN